MKFIYLPTFVKRLKELGEKYPSIKNDFSTLLKELEANPHTGVEPGKDCYKIRLAIKSRGRGKSGGARLITCVSGNKWTQFTFLQYMIKLNKILYLIVS